MEVLKAFAVKYLILVVQRMQECILEDVLMIASILPVRPRSLSARIPSLTCEAAVQLY